jgi:hypothetical protein
MVMKIIVLSLIFVIVGSVGAQTANVVELSKADSEEVKQAYDRLQDAQVHWQAIQDNIREKYAMVPEGDATAGRTVITTIAGKNRVYREGFEFGIEFSKDFRFIVPKSESTKVTKWPYPVVYE